MIPKAIEEVTGEWLSERTGSPVSVVSVEPMSAGTAFTTRMFRLHLDGPDVPQTVLVKLPVTGPVREFIDGVGAYARELGFYRQLADKGPLRVPQCFVAEMADDSTDFVLVIEELLDARPGDTLAGLTLAEAEIAIDALAAFHAHFWNSELETFPRMAVGPVFGPFFGHAWPVVKEAYSLSGDLATFGDRYVELLPWFVAELGAPMTITHGELRADNLFLTDDSLILIDFQTIARQSPMIDIGYLLSQSVAAEVRRGRDETFVRRYVERLGVAAYGFESAMRQYRISIAYNLVWAVLMHGQSAGLDARGTALVDAMLTRAFTAIHDNDCLAVLP